MTEPTTSTVDQVAGELVARPSYAVIFDRAGTRPFVAALAQLRSDAEAVLGRLSQDQSHRIVKLSNDMPGVDVAPWIEEPADADLIGAIAPAPTTED